MPRATVEGADYHLDGDLTTDPPEEYARKAYAFFLHEIGKSSEAEDDGDAGADLYLRSSMVLSRVAALLRDERCFIDHAMALIEVHEQHEESEIDDEDDLPTAADLLR